MRSTNAITTSQTADYVAISRQTSDVIQKYISTPAVSGDARAAIAD